MNLPENIPREGAKKLQDVYLRHFGTRHPRSMRRLICSGKATGLPMNLPENIPREGAKKLQDVYLRNFGTRSRRRLICSGKATDPPPGNPTAIFR
jgi:hypothetical protein